MAESPALLMLPCAPQAALAECAEDLGLAERVACALGATGYLPLRAVEVSVQGRVTVLQGRVPSYHLKQVAQVTALAVPGVQELHNDLVVVRST
jgi:osmotically-inducible protein OsmY